MGSLLNASDVADANRAVRTLFEWRASETDWRSDPVAVTWRSAGDVRPVLDRHLFVELDQVVLPALNLKAAKSIVCRDERQKKALRRLGFIEDRTQIRNVRRWS